jgi:3-phytase
VSRLGKVWVAVAATVVGIGSFLLVVTFYRPGTPAGSGEPGGSGPPSATPGTAATRPATPSRTKPKSGGVKPLIRDGAPRPTAGEDGPPAIVPSVETELFPKAEGDVADDSAIWRNPGAPDRSLVLADDKSRSGGVAVFDLTGDLVHYERGGKIGNIDLRDGVRAGNRTITLVGANDRASASIRLWSLDHTRGTLSPVAAGKLPTMAKNYGFCLGRSPDHARLYAIVTDEGSGKDETGGGLLEQYELTATPAGTFTARKVRSLNVGSQSEGCAVDDATGALYVAQEDVGIWRYALDPATKSRRTKVDSVEGDNLSADVEGVSVTRGPKGDGVLIASSQGDSTYSVYDLDGENAFLGSFQIRGKGKIDGTNETDGLDIAAGDFGEEFPNGLLVAHDAENRDPSDDDEPASNLKLVRLDRVIALS